MLFPINVHVSGIPIPTSWYLKLQMALVLDLHWLTLSLPCIIHDVKDVPQNIDFALDLQSLCIYLTKVKIQLMKYIGYRSKRQYLLFCVHWSEARLTGDVRCHVWVHLIFS